MAVKQPKNVKFRQVKDGTGATFELVWDKGFAADMNGRLDYAQFVFDAEVYRESKPYMPFDEGEMLRNSDIANATLAGTGVVEYRAPYARYLWYGKLMVDPVTGKGAFFSEDYGFWSRPGVKKTLTDTDLEFQGAPMRGARWTERMWAEKGTQIVMRVQKAFDKGKK